MRADLYLTVNGHTSGRQLAKKLIEEGNVRVDGRVIRKPAEDIPEGEHLVEVFQNRQPYSQEMVVF